MLCLLYFFRRKCQHPQFAITIMHSSLPGKVLHLTRSISITRIQTRWTVNDYHLTVTSASEFEALQFNHHFFHDHWIFLVLTSFIALIASTLVGFLGFVLLDLVGKSQQGILQFQHVLLNKNDNVHHLKSYNPHKTERVANSKSHPFSIIPVLVYCISQSHNRFYRVVCCQASLWEQYTS